MLQPSSFGTWGRQRCGESTLGTPSWAKQIASNPCICRSSGMLGATGLLLQDKDGAPEEIEQLANESLGRPGSATGEIGRAYGTLK